MAVPPPTLEERGKTDVAVPHWNILPGERATVALILTACGQDVKGVTSAGNGLGSYLGLTCRQLPAGPHLELALSMKRRITRGFRLLGRTAIKALL